MSKYENFTHYNEINQQRYSILNHRVRGHPLRSQENQYYYWKLQACTKYNLKSKK